MIRTILRLRRQITTVAAVVHISLLTAPAAHAAGSSMPWEAPLQSILEAIEGPVAKIVAVIIIIVTGLSLAFGDTSGGFRRLSEAERTAAAEQGRVQRQRFLTPGSGYQPGNARMFNN